MTFERDPSYLAFHPPYPGLGGKRSPCHSCWSTHDLLTIAAAAGNPNPSSLIIMTPSLMLPLGQLHLKLPHKPPPACCFKHRGFAVLVQ